MRTRAVVIGLVAVGLCIPLGGAHAKEADRGVTIVRAGLSDEGSVRVKIRWDKSDLRQRGTNALSTTVVAFTGSGGTPVLRRSLSAKATQPQRQYSISLSPGQQVRVAGADGLGFSATQKSGLKGGLYSQAWVTHAGDFQAATPRHALGRAGSRCNPVQAGGSYSGCYYGYTDLSNMNLSSATFADANFSFATLTGTNFTGSDLSLTQLGYAAMKNANLTNANLSGAYLYGANLSGAVTTGAVFTNAQYCKTVMPDGSTNNSNC